MDKLCRWASKLQGFGYIIEHLPGEDNLWAEMLSRWIPKPSKASIMALRAPIGPLLEKDFSWTSILEIQQCQEQSSPDSLEVTSSDGILMFMDKVLQTICAFESVSWVTAVTESWFSSIFRGNQNENLKIFPLGINRRTHQILLWQLPSLQSQ